MNNKNNPTEIAQIVSDKYLKKGYQLDFSKKSLEQEIDSILENEITSNEPELIGSELVAYIGETICKLIGAQWSGDYYLNNSGMNFYSCKIEKDEFEFKPSHFISYYISNGKKSEGSFKNYFKEKFKDFNLQIN